MLQQLKVRAELNRATLGATWHLRKWKQRKTQSADGTMSMRYPSVRSLPEVIIRHMRAVSRLFASAALMLLVSLASQGQVVEAVHPRAYLDAAHLGDSINLSSEWAFQAGDDSRWSRADFDDSHWRVISTTDSWQDQGVSRPLDIFWYRLHVKLPLRHPPLSLLFGYSAFPYEVYVNGQLVGRYGRLPPKERVDGALVRVFELPSSAVGDITIAVRFLCWWRWESRYVWGGIVGQRGLVLGTTRAIDDEYRAWQSQRLYELLPDFSVGFLSILLAVGLLFLYRTQRKQSEYLWIAAYFAVITAWTFINDFQAVAPISIQSIKYLDVAVRAVSEILLLQFVFAFLRQSIPRWLWIYQMSLLGLPLVVAAYFAGRISLGASDMTVLLWELPYAVVIPALLLWRYIRGLTEAGFLVIPLVLVNLNGILNSLAWLLYEIRLRDTDADFIPSFHLGLIPISIGQIDGLLFVLGIAAVLLHRFHKTSREQERAQAEFEAARSMQEVMLPQEIGSTPGFAIETVYIPAQEVGGDFFRLFPGSDESLLVVIGDVSGKGVKAAMLVSLIVGLLQKIVEATREPSRVLGDLNTALSGHTGGSFATCSCALISPDGHFRIANAGHLSPYCHGREMEIPGGLPVGIALGTTYDQIGFNLRPGDRVVFLSDGIVEARSKSGELYGFKRASAISTEPAGVIAMAAQRFGQEDDITVLSVELRALPNRKSTQGAVTYDCPLPSSSAGISPFGFALK
jgi:sigma-B regulation protein RsbU (phosphoserine phosphatase)